MNVSDAIKERFSTRAFLNKEINKDIIYKILDIARFSPSGHNSQPWEVLVITGKKKELLSQKLIEAVKNRKERKYDYYYGPKEYPHHIKERRKECNTLIFKHKNIDPKKDKEKLLEHILENFKFFNAPAELIITTDRSMGCATFIDLGIFAQSIMLTALEFGLATCPQTSIAMYPYVIREVLGLPENKMIVYGIAIGYPDPKAHINKLRMPRDKVEKFTTFYK